MTKNEFIQQALLRLIPIAYNESDEECEKLALDVAFHYAIVAERIAFERGIEPFFDGDLHSSIFEEYEKIPISYLSLSVRASNFCFRLGILSVADLLRFGSYKLKECKGFKDSILKEVKEGLKTKYNIDYF